MKKKQTIIDKQNESRGGVIEDHTKRQIKAFYDPKTKTAIASTDSVDRMGEIIDQSGWDLENFKSNPVLLWAHDDKTPRIGTAKAIRIEKANGKSALMFEPKFNEATELSRAIKEIFEEEGGTFSVGFIPMEMDGNTFTKAELLEISAVNVPANADARTLAYKSLITKGISKDIAAEVAHIDKGAIQDELEAEAAWDKKWDNMSSIREVFYAFCDVYFDSNTDVEQFGPLLTEFIALLGTISDGTYVDPDPDEGEEEAGYSTLSAKVLDNRKRQGKDKGNKAKAPSAASKKHHEERISMAKILARAADILNKNEKLPDVDRKSVTKVIKRASDIIIEQHKGEL